ncbi:MAG TPA: AAA family ATPase [Acetobacteraceae bacterium]|nr:AAA family ATPase [Acetobacteraceae bacterium]
MNCPRCGTPAPVGQKFCGECGTALESRGGGFTPAPPGERRQLTVMFCDMVGSTAIGARLDPEDFRDVVETYHRCVAENVTRLGGFVARYMGDGVLTYFGYPAANEDDAERAVRAGIAIVEAVPRLDTIAGPPPTLCARIGIATGMVIVGHLISAGESLERAVVGDAPNLASRLQSLAEPGTVLIDESTRRLIGGLFDYSDIGTRTIKGYEQPVRVCRVLRESSIDSRFEALRAGGAAPLFGRTDELALLLHRWRDAQRGAGRIVMLSGEAGIGKSRLAAALENHLRSEPHIRRRYLCSPHHQDTLLHPVIGQLARAAGFEREDDATAKLHKLAALLPPGASAEEFALIADLLSLPAPAEAKLADLTPQRRKERTFAAILRQLERLTDASPVLAVVEDLHWADPTTLELLARIVEQIGRMRLLLVVTSRPGVQVAWIDHPAVSEQPLGRFDRRQANALIDGVADASRLSEAVRNQIIAHADGVPLFVEELTKSVLEMGAAGAGSNDVVPGRRSPVVVPSSLHASLMARLDRLAGGKEVAQMGAVIGREFSFELFRSVFPITVDRLHGSLRALVAADLIVEQGHPPRLIYSFRHALVQDAAYSSLLRDRRRELHHQVALGLERDEGGLVEPELLAYHFAEAAITDRAIDYHLKAAERAMARCALTEMVSHLRRGIGLLNGLPDSRETRRQELALQVALGRGLIDQVGSASEQGHAAFVRARELCLEVGDTDLLLSVLYGLQVYHFSHAEPAAVIRYAQEILDLGHRTGRRAAILVGERVAGSAYLLLGRLADARAAYEHLLALYEADKDSDLASETARDPFVAGCSFLAICLTLMGYPAQGEASGRRGLRHAEHLQHAISVVFALRRGCVDAMLRRDVEQVRLLSARLLEVSTDYETFLGGPEGHLFQSWALLHESDDASLWERLQRSLDQLDETRTWALLPFLMAAAAELGATRGNLADARRLLLRAKELGDQTGERWCQPEIIRLEAALLNDDPAEKATLLHRAIELSREQGSHLWSLRGAIDLAELLRDQGQPDKARELLAPIHGWFSEGFDAPDLRRGSRLLETLG